MAIILPTLAIALAVLRIIRHPGSGSSHPRGAVLAMGNFDGLHLGHAALIREACERARAAGKPREAAAQLGRFWEINGRVMVGDRRGRTIGFPTANLGLGEYLRPAFGVYAVRVSGDGPDDALAGRTIDGVANIGLRPTVGTPEPRLEAHLFDTDTDTDLYGRHLSVSLVEFIRPEKKFAGLDALKAQIAADAGRARQILAAVPS